MALVGTWNYEKAENLEEYMKATNVPENLREMALKSKPTMTMENNGDQWTIKTIVGEKTKDSTFTIGQEFDSVSLTGQPLKCKVTMDGGKMVESQTAEGQEVIITREVVGDKLVSKMSFGGQTATVSFTRQ